jgi:hypothetical protein
MQPNIPLIPDEPIPCSLGADDVQEFKQIILETTGEELTNQEAWDAARRVMELLRVLSSPLPDQPDSESRFDRHEEGHPQIP